mmetsp:Transcript_9277/g.21559  ORF Transcript_9277/g.21559 Transcript_9277/m.21559 type:complete len:241 (+) Transcript_9277:750-1472(+)
MGFAAGDTSGLNGSRPAHQRRRCSAPGQSGGNRGRGGAATAATGRRASSSDAAAHVQPKARIDAIDGIRAGRPRAAQPRVQLFRDGHVLAECSRWCSLPHLSRRLHRVARGCGCSGRIRRHICGAEAPEPRRGRGASRAADRRLVHRRWRQRQAARRLFAFRQRLSGAVTDAAVNYAAPSVPCERLPGGVRLCGRRVPHEPARFVRWWHAARLQHQVCFAYFTIPYCVECVVCTSPSHCN